MDTDIKDKLAQLETEVAVIKDPTLRQIAFGKLMDTIVQLSPAGRTSRLQKARKSGPSRAPNPSKRKNKAAAFYAIGQVREEVQKLPLTGTSKGLPNFRDCKKGWETVFWVLAAAKQGGFEGLNNHEIAYLLTKRLYKTTKYSTVNNVRKQVGAGFVGLDPETQRWMIRPEGEDYLRGLAKSNEPSKP